MVAAARPDLSTEAAELGQQLLSQRPLQDTSTGTVGTDFCRRSCCLIYRAAPAGAPAICGDCVLTATDRPRQV
jgi:ferric iron reductase protein FhuF